MANKVADPTAAGAGTYYAAFFDATNNCYSPASASIVVTINSCTPIALSNVCPATTVNLTTAVSASNVPSGTIVTYHTSSPATTANKVADPTVAGAGTYYAAFLMLRMIATVQQVHQLWLPLIHVRQLP